MAYPRHLLVPPDAPGIHHCASRCVRRAFFCGEDAVTGRSFEHRKQWLEERIIELGGVFAVAVHAYAVMSNHLVLEVEPRAPQGWPDEEVARRWLAPWVSTSARHAHDVRPRSPCTESRRSPSRQTAAGPPRPHASSAFLRIHPSVPSAVLTQ